MRCTPSIETDPSKDSSELLPQIASVSQVLEELRETLASLSLPIPTSTSYDRDVRKALGSKFADGVLQCRTSRTSVAPTKVCVVRLGIRGLGFLLNDYVFESYIVLSNTDMGGVMFILPAVTCQNHKVAERSDNNDSPPDPLVCNIHHGPQAQILGAEYNPKLEGNEGLVPQRALKIGNSLLFFERRGLVPQRALKIGAEGSSSSSELISVPSKFLELDTPGSESSSSRGLEVDYLANEYLLEEDSDLDLDLKNFKSID
ncbi:hypothetical protein RND71_042335 [Anisodus tanguticus]|uniref:Uncharacterized protein n=1 Tax=Anisodus tanguticus TaxID=243964 RepID=A0AAE1QSA5_9SOLA|nr:hypothetical protein RND71_042335 [Anisodus tanguticus]